MEKAKREMLERYKRSVQYCHDAYNEMVADRNHYTESYFYKCYGRRQEVYEILCEMFDAKAEAEEIFKSIEG